MSDYGSEKQKVVCSQSLLGLVGLDYHLPCLAPFLSQLTP